MLEPPVDEERPNNDQEQGKDTLMSNVNLIVKREE